MTVAPALHFSPRHRFAGRQVQEEGGGGGGHKESVELTGW